MDSTISPQPVFLCLLLCLCRTVLIYLLLEKPRLSAFCTNQEPQSKPTLLLFLYTLPSIVLKLVLLPHASVAKDVCFQSGCSCHQGGQEMAFDLTWFGLTLMWLNIFRPPMTGYMASCQVCMFDLFQTNRLWSSGLALNVYSSAFSTVVIAWSITCRFL